MNFHPDQNISRCPSCGGWQWLDWCHTCEGSVLIIAPDSEVA